MEERQQVIRTREENRLNGLDAHRNGRNGSAIANNTDKIETTGLIFSYQSTVVNLTASQLEKISRPVQICVLRPLRHDSDKTPPNLREIRDNPSALVRYP